MDTNRNTFGWFLIIVVALAGLLTACASQDSGMQYSSAGSAAESLHGVQNDEYRLATGDVISIRIYGGEEEFRLERIRLDQSGVVNLPFGQFITRGQTAQEVEGAIMHSIAGRLLRNPRVWVNIDEYRPFFVEGQVGRPGAYPFQPGLNVRKAVAIAGGLKERASLSKMYVFRESTAGTTRLKVNLNSPVVPGDTVMVEESFF